jgi:hypothetical protein
MGVSSCGALVGILFLWDLRVVEKLVMCVGDFMLVVIIIGWSFFPWFLGGVGGVLALFSWVFPFCILLVYIGVPYAFNNKILITYKRREPFP